MSFAIEVSGEAIPLAFDTLCRTLQAATAHDDVQRQTAGQQLTSWEERPGYYLTLQSVLLDKTLPTDVRLLAVIQLKNGIEKYWRLSIHARESIKQDEKVHIRSRLFQGTIDEPEKTLALHNALVIAKVVRIDYPNEWPDSLPKIIELLRSFKDSHQQHLQGTLQILLRVTKELSSARLKRSQTALQRVTPEIVYILNEIYSTRSAQWTAFLISGQGSEADANLTMLNSLLSLRLLRRLIISGYEAPHTDKTVERFWISSQEQFGRLLALVNDTSSTVPVDYHVVIGKHLLQFTKLHVDMAEVHSVSFTAFPNTLALVHGYWGLVAKFAEVYDSSGGIRQGSTDSGSAKAKVEGPLLERLALRGLILLRASVRIAYHPVQTFKYRSPEAKMQQKEAGSFIRTKLLEDSFVIQVVNCLITHLFIFRRSDLEAWEEDPEEWEHQEQSEGNAYEWEVRPCAEKLFLDLLTNYKQLLVPPLLSYFEMAQGPQAEMATKEAVYTAMGLSAAHVAAVFDFGAVVASTLVHDAQQQGPLYKVLRRRIAILISQWAPVGLSDDSRSLVYQIFRHFLNPSDENNDLVVRITAARQLRWIVDEIDFSTEAFLPHASEVLTQTLQLMQTVEVDETKLAILESVRILVTRLDEHVAQFGDQIMSALPSIWERTGADEYMIKQAVIAILTALAMSMGSGAKRYHGFMVPLLAEAARPGSEMHIHLIDESLELWNAILIQCGEPLGSDVTGLAELALPLLEYQSETASQALSVVESYIVMTPKAMLEEGLRRKVLSALALVLGSKSREQIRAGAGCVEYLIRAAATFGGAAGVSVIIEDMISTGLMEMILYSLKDAWGARQTSGPNRKISRLNMMTEGDYLAVLSRLALAEPSPFVQLLSRVGNVDEVWGWLSSEWFWYIDSVDQIEVQKLLLLGLTRLLELSSPMQELVLGKLQNYLEMWNMLLIELRDDGGKVGQTDMLTQAETEQCSVEFDTCKMVVERQLRGSDPVYSENGLGFFEPRLRDLIARVGGEAIFQEQWAVNVDREVLAQFQAIQNGTWEDWERSRRVD
ncbi:hypothetical protein L249_0485 [Ophiocordyceps polyrhachis-furcata BCC 54312]|uniref:Importin N-terminal domain-containing protein n=1 Tax=Ophiocordyceps polyrhachis-furcata BCC 54312 TaxID=1330021 RepID=A0A367LEY1_9HYPO|nr:hypothetical protein L249_0485 [Ophiocordyceps polyrhachis-furcata BCC 54312]